MITSAQEFIRLRESHDPTEYNRAANENMPGDVWLELVENYPCMHAWLAHNKLVPLWVLEYLSNSDDSDVRCSVAAKRKIGEELQFKLSQDRDESVRLRLCFNSKTTTKVLNALSKDSWSEIRERAKEQLSGRGGV